MGKWIGFGIKISITILLCIAVGASQPGRPGAKSNSGPRAPFLLQAKSYEETTFVTKVGFKNGMTVLVQEVRSLPYLSIQAYVNTGASSQIAQDPGLAELMASVLCRGGGNTGTGTNRQKVQLLGGFITHAADTRNTMYEIVVPSEQWKQALALEEEVLLHPSFDANAIQMEGRLAREDTLGTLSDPAEFSRQKLIELAFGESPFVKYRISAEEVIAKNISEKLSALHRSLYVPSGITIVVSGDVRSSDILNEVCKLFDQSAQPQAKSNLQQNIVEQKGSQYRALAGNIPVPRLLFGFRTPTEKENDFRALEVLNVILGIGEAAVLPSRLRDQKNLVYSAESRLDSYPNSGFLSIEMTADPQNIDRSEIAALTEIELLKRNGPNPFEMERAIGLLEHDYWKKNETVSGKASTLARFEMLGNWKRKDRYIDELRKVKATDIARVASQYLTLKNCSLLEYLPKTMEARNLEPEGVFKTFEGLLEPSANQEQEVRSREIVYAVDLPKERPPFQYSEIQYPFQKASILRGPDMYIREDHTSPLIDLGIFFPGGKQYENSSNSGITEMMTHIMLQGDKDHHGSQFLYQMEVFGARLRPVVADDYFGFAFSILGANFAPAFNLLQEAIKNPVFSKEAVQAQKELQSNRILQRDASRNYFRKLVDQMLFKDFPYALDATGTQTSVAGITAEAVHNWHAETVRNKKPIVIAIGDASGTSLATYFVGSFSGSRMQSAEILKDFVKPIDKSYSSEKQGVGGGSEVFIGFQAPPIEDEDWQIAKVLESYLGGQGKFAQEIRDRQGTANQVSLIYEPKLRGGSIIASANMNSENETIVLKKMKEEIQKIFDAPIDPRDLRAALNSAIGSRGIRNQIRANQIVELTDNLLAGKELAEYQDFAKDVMEITAEDVKATAKKIFNMDKSVLLRVHANSQ